MFKVPEYQACKLGDSGPEVTLLQELLTFNGYPVKLDGKFGPATMWALQLFFGDSDIEDVSKITTYSNILYSLLTEKFILKT